MRTAQYLKLIKGLPALKRLQIAEAILKSVLKEKGIEVDEEDQLVNLEKNALKNHLDNTADNAS